MAGTEGILVAFGGVNISAGANQISDFGVIYVYDIATHTWYSQLAGGIVPIGISFFCTGVSTLPDDQAFHVTVYGEWSQEEGRAVETVYALSLPSFTWIDVSAAQAASNEEEMHNHTDGRLSPSCQVYHGTLLVVLGGETLEAGQFSSDGSCSNFSHPLRVLDLSTCAWQSVLNTTTSYQVPEAIYSVIGGR